MGHEGESYPTGNKFPGSKDRLLEVEGSSSSLSVLGTFCTLRGKD